MMLRTKDLRQPWMPAVMLLLLCGVSWCQDLPKAPGGTVTLLTSKPGYFTEPAVAVNPKDPQQVVVAYQSPVRISYSTDGGQSWADAPGIAPQNYRVSGDVSVTYDSRGHAIICYMAFDKLGTFNYWGHGATRNGLFIRRSLDGGKTWEAEHIPVIEQPTEPGIPAEDKAYIVADTSRGPHSGNLYVGWTRWTLTDSEILLSRSTDGGTTWSKPIEIDGHPGLPRDDTGANEGFDGVVGPDGTLYATWSTGTEIMLTTSRDGGQTFSPPVPVVHTAPSMFAVQGLERANGFPQIAMDPRGSPHGGDLYLTWSDYRNGDLDVFCAKSQDQGRSWSAPVRVNNDSIHDGADQFFQWLAVDPTSGAVNVAFYDRRGDPKNEKQIVVLARSSDAGETFENYAWTNNPFDASGVFFGDYTGLAAFGNRVYGAWTEKPEQPEADEKAPPDATSKRHGTTVKVGVADFGKPTTR
jgi:hypothetical protein